ncbi:MAG: hypothetical protein AAF702_14775 [Chloroflexota bacterium]
MYRSSPDVLRTFYYAAAVVHAAVALRPDLPTSVFPDPPSVPIYRRIGFEPAGKIAIWSRSE